MKPDIIKVTPHMHPTTSTATGSFSRLTKSITRAKLNKFDFYY